MFRAVSVFPGPFTLDGAEAVAGPDAGRAVPRLVDRSLLVPPRAGPDGRTRYAMLETLRAYGAGLLAQAGEDGEVTAALAEYAAEVAEAGLRRAVHAHRGGGQPAAAGRRGCHPAPRAGLGDGARPGHGAAARAQPGSQWWSIRGRLISQAPLLAAAAEHAEAGSDEWCGARMLLAQAASQPPIRSRPWSTTPRSGTPSRTPDRPASWPGGARAAVALPGRPVGGAAADGPGGRGGRRRPPGAGRGPPDRLPGPGSDRPDLPRHGRLAGRRPGRRAPARAPGAGYPGRVRRRPVPGPQPVRDDDPDRDRRPGRRRAGLRGRAGLVPGSGRPGQPERPAVEPGRSWTCGPAAPTTRRRICASSSRSPCRPGCGLSSWPAWTAAATCARPPGARPRRSRRGRRRPRSAAPGRSRTSPGTWPSERNSSGTPGNSSGRPGPGRPRNAARP